MAVKFNYNTGIKTTYNGLVARRSRMNPDWYFFDNGRVINAKTKLMANYRTNSDGTVIYDGWKWATKKAPVKTPKKNNEVTLDGGTLKEVVVTAPKKLKQKTYTSNLQIPKEDSKTYYTPVHGQDSANGIDPIRVGDNKMVETGPTTENLGEAVIQAYRTPVILEVEVPISQATLKGIPITTNEFNFANPQSQDFNNVYQGLRNQGYGRRIARRMMRNPNYWSNFINLNQDIYNQQMNTPEGRVALARANFINASLNFDKYQQGGKMNDKQLQEAFIQFLAQKSGAKNEKELEAYVKQLGEDGLKQAYAEFTEVMQQQARKAKQGAKLNYIKQLKHQCPEGQELVYFKKGGLVDCGCKGKKMEDGGKTPEKQQSAIEKFRNRKNDKNLKGDWNSQKAREQQRKNREEAAKGEGESPVTDKNFNKGYKKNEKGGKVSKAGAGCMIKSKFIKKGSKVKMGCK